MGRYFLALSLLFLPFQSFADAPQCEKFPAPLPGGFCISKSASNPDVVYYLHGSGGSENTWGDEYYYTNQLRTAWQQKKVQAPTVIAVSFGPNWLLAPKNSSPASGLLDLFVNQIVPSLESKVGNPKGRRMVFGESMGGFNTIQLAFKTQLFIRAAALCAPMSADTTPFSSDAEITAAIQKTAAYHINSDPSIIFQNVKFATQLSRTFYPTLQEWQAGDPFVLARNVDVSKLPKLYSAAGFYDEFATYEGNAAFAQILKDKGADIDWRPQWGHHCAIDISSLADFLTN
jgi:S-formylglutathione hydrolase FrmB